MTKVRFNKHDISLLLFVTNLSKLSHNKAYLDDRTITTTVIPDAEGIYVERNCLLCARLGLWESARERE